MDIRNTGPSVKMISWTSLIQAISYHDSRWASWEERLTSLQDNQCLLTSDTSDLLPHADARLIIDDGAINRGLPADMQAVPEHSVAPIEIDTPIDAVAVTRTATPHQTKAASAARTMALARSIVTSHNILNMRVMLIGGQALVSRQAWLAQGRTSMASQSDAITLHWSKYG